jgi:DNA mismatch endonuclease, patch repair protein
MSARTSEDRRRAMARVRAKNTGPELVLRRALHAAGVRGWRCHYARAPGSPDLAWPARRLAVFVDGAFWHGHPSRASSGRDSPYWRQKVARNMQRDAQVNDDLAEAGWRVLRLWDFEVTRDTRAAVRRVQEALQDSAPSAG